MTATPPPELDALAFPRMLQAWRRKRRFSQLGLALESGVSQRHVSFLESGRSKPSRGMVLQLSEILELPLRERNAMLLAAGFAPVFRSLALEDPLMTQVRTAIHRMLDSHDPYPAVAVDRAWNIRFSNRAFDRLETWLGPGLWSRVGTAQRNLLALFFHPDGIRPYVVNWKTIAPLLWLRARREAEALGGQDMKAVLEGLAPFQDPDLLHISLETPLLPFLPLELERDGVRLSLFSVISTFGTAQDVTTDELRIESLFPADDATELLLQALASR